jgi:hypothetical protein
VFFSHGCFVAVGGRDAELARPAYVFWLLSQASGCPCKAVHHVAELAREVEEAEKALEIGSGVKERG